MEKRERWWEKTRKSKTTFAYLEGAISRRKVWIGCLFFSQASSERGRTRVKWRGGWKNKKRNVAQKWTPGLFLAREYFNSTRKIRLVRLSFIFQLPFSPYRWQGHLILIQVPVLSSSRVFPRPSIFFLFQFFFRHCEIKIGRLSRWFVLLV